MARARGIVMLSCRRTPPMGNPRWSTKFRPSGSEARAMRISPWSARRNEAGICCVGVSAAAAHRCPVAVSITGRAAAWTATGSTVGARRAKVLRVSRRRVFRCADVRHGWKAFSKTHSLPAFRRALGRKSADVTGQGARRSPRSNDVIALSVGGDVHRVGRPDAFAGCRCGRLTSAHRPSTLAVPCRGTRRHPGSRTTPMVTARYPVPGSSAPALRHALDERPGHRGHQRMQRHRSAPPTVTEGTSRSASKTSSQAIR